VIIISSIEKENSICGAKIWLKDSRTPASFRSSWIKKKSVNQSIAKNPVKTFIAARKKR